MKSLSRTFALIGSAIVLSTSASHAGEATARKESATVSAEDVSLFPIPKLTGTFWENGRLLGDLGGPRQSLAERGIQIDFNMTHTYQGVFEGGESQEWSRRVSDSVSDGFSQLLSRGLVRAEDSDSLLGRALTRPIARRGDITLGEVIQNRIDRLSFPPLPQKNVDDWEYQGTWRLELKLDTHMMGLWPGGFIFMRAEQGYGRDINSRANSLLPPNINASLPLPGADDVTVPHLYITQFLSKHVALAIGKLDPTGGDANEFAHITGDERFLGAAFAANPVVSLLAPYSALGATLLIMPSKDLIISAGAIDGEGRATRSGFDTVWEGRTTYLAEARLTTHIGGKLGHQLIGGAIGSGTFFELEQPLQAFIPATGANRRESDESWAVYYNFDQYLWHPTIATDGKGGTRLDTTRGIGIFGRVGFADERTNSITQFYSFGFGGKGLGTGRPHDRWGLGWYYMRTSRDLPDFLHLGDEQGVEAFYNYAVTPAFLVTADLQVTHSGKEGTDTAVIGGLRATLRF